MRKLTLTLFVASLFVGAPAAFAGDKHAPHDGASMMKDADRDGDGRLNRDEYDSMSSTSQNPGANAPLASQGVPATEHQANVIDDFENRDRDGDGYVSADEFAQKDD